MIWQSFVAFCEQIKSIVGVNVDTVDGKDFVTDVGVSVVILKGGDFGSHVHIIYIQMSTSIMVHLFV